MKKPTLSYPWVRVDAAGAGVVSHAGGVLLVESVRASGLDRALSAGLARWRTPLAVHDPAKVVTDLAIALTLGGDCLADVAVLRAEPGVFGPVASDPTVSRTIDALAKDAARALAAIDTARTTARARVWELAAEHAPDAAGHRRRRDPGDGAQRQGIGGADKSNTATDSIHCGHSSTTDRAAPANRPRYSSGRATPEVTPPRTTSQ